MAAGFGVSRTPALRVDGIMQSGKRRAPLMIGHRHDASGSGWRSRLGRLRLAGAVVLLTLLLHALALMGLVRGFDSGSSRADTRRAPVQVSLIPGDPAEPVDPVAEAPAMAPTRPPAAPVPPAPLRRLADPGDDAPVDGVPPADSDGAGMPPAAADPMPVGAGGIGTPGDPRELPAMADPTPVTELAGTAGQGASVARDGPDAGAAPSATAAPRARRTWSSVRPCRRAMSNTSPIMR